VKLLDPSFVAKIETQCMKTVALWNLTTHFSALSKVVAVVRDYHVRVKWMATHLAITVLIVARCGILLGHTLDLSH
jgi:hypothetical protein